MPVVSVPPGQYLTNVRWREVQFLRARYTKKGRKHVDLYLPLPQPHQPPRSGIGFYLYPIPARCSSPVGLLNTPPSNFPTALDATPPTFLRSSNPRNQSVHELARGGEPASPPPPKQQHSTFNWPAKQIPT